MSIITILLIVLVALLAGMEGVLDEFQFHQPLVACTLIGIVSGHMKEGIILGGSLQMMALGWANVGAAIAPDAALASVASAIIMVLGLQGGATDVNNAISTSIAVAVPLSVAGLFLTMICRTIAIPMVHFMDAAAEKGNIRMMEVWQNQIAALKRHMEFYNTHPYVSAPVMGVTLALEEERANGVSVDDAAIQGVKVGMMGPLAGVGDPVFWFTLRPILGALGASLALSGNIIGPLLFFVAWNVIRWAFIWYTQEFGYKVGTSIVKDLSGGLLGKITSGASILGMFIIGSLVQRWVSISFTPVVSTVTQSKGAFIDWDNLSSGIDGVREAITQYDALGSTGLNVEKVTTLQQNLDQLIPGLAALLLTLLCCWLLKKKVSPIIIIIALFIVGILARLGGVM